MINFNDFLSVKALTTESAYVLEDGTELPHGKVRDEYIGKWRYLLLLHLPSGWFRLREIEIPKVE